MSPPPQQQIMFVGTAWSREEQKPITKILQSLPMEFVLRMKTQGQNMLIRLLVILYFKAIINLLSFKPFLNNPAMYIVTNLKRLI